MSKPKLLLISGIAPFPQTSGGATRLLETLRCLSKKYAIYGYYFTHDSIALNQEESAYLQQYTVSFKPIHCKLKSIATSLLKSIPYHFTDYWSPELIANIQSDCQISQFDEVRIETTQLLYLSRFLPLNVSKTFVALDVSSISFWRRAFDTCHLVKRFVRLLSCAQTYFYELVLLRGFTNVLVMSEIDKNFIKKLFNISNVRQSPNGIRKIEFLPQRNQQIVTIGFVGSQSHTPNQQAVIFLLEKILPQLPSNHYRYLILGSHAKNTRNVTRNGSVQYLEQLDDITDFYSQIDVLVAPIFSGSGTRIKILESLSYGRPVITTQIGAEGLPIDSPFLQIVPSTLQDDPAIWATFLRRLSFPLLIKQQKNLQQQLEPLTWDALFLNE